MPRTTSHTRLHALIAFALLVPAIALAAPDPSPDNDAGVVFLRSDCDVAGSPKENCFESMAALSDLSTGWIWNVRSPSPSASSPLIVDIGPGEFGPFHCDSGGHVTLRGSGREQTILADDDVAVDAKHCEDLSFIDIGFHGGRIGVSWTGTGFSTWSDTDIVLTGEADAVVEAAWSDVVDFSQPGCGVHYFHGSRVRTLGSGSTSTTAYYSQCGEAWFFGGEITTLITQSNDFADAIRLTSTMADVRVFGTAVRARVGTGGDVYDIIGIRNNAGTFHAHGSVVNVSSVGSQNGHAIGLQSGSSAFSHTPGTTWIVTPTGTGDARRIDASAGATVLSPFLWESGSTPPAITSQHGSDLFVETDCDANGCSGGQDPHLLIYSENCGGAGGPWFDVARQSCRN